MEQQGALPLQRAPFPRAGYAQASPSTALKNPELALQLGVDPEWIRARCGVDSRYISGPGETTTTLGVRAARQALTNAPSYPRGADDKEAKRKQQRHDAAKSPNAAAAARKQTQTGIVATAAA